MPQTTIAGRARNGYRAGSWEIRISKTIALESDVSPTRTNAVAIAWRIRSHHQPGAVEIGTRASEQGCARVKLSQSSNWNRA